jgi:YVTN family beta-propeller protein
MLAGQPQEHQAMTRVWPMAAIALGLALGPARAEAPLALEAKIPLGDVGGRIDHLALDVAGQRLFVAELGNDSVGVVDLAARRVVQRIGRLREPQGVAWLPASGTLVVANAKDGSVRFYAGAPLVPTGILALHDDADNVRGLPDGSSVMVGYGSGGLAVIDVAHQATRADIALKGHPESFQLDPAGARVFVNVPDADEIVVVDRAAGRQIASWPVPDARANFPLAWLAARGEVVAVFRRPARLVRLRAADGAIAANQATCGDADDVFHDARRDRLYVVCGDGMVDVLQAHGEADYARLAEVPTVPGARTGWFSPERDRLYVAVRARGSEPAAIWVFAPQ